MNRFLISPHARWIATGCLVLLALWVAFLGISTSADNQAHTIADKPSTSSALQVPQADGTQEPPIPTATATATEPVVTDTPLPANLQPATIITPSAISGLALDTNIDLTEKSSVNSSEAVHSFTFAPTGDKLLYMSLSGSLYWSNLDGSGATLIQIYDPAANYNLLDDQMPKANTMLIPGYAIQFTAGQAPLINAAPDTLGVSQIRWWSATRASGIGGIVGGYIGGEQLVTLDANGQLVSSVNIPYMESGAVQPGGTWLAYATSQQTTDVQLVGSSPQTIYLLNLSTGQRLQLTQPGMGWRVFSWSPDGNWIYASAIVGTDLEGVLVSADGLQWVIVTPPGHSGYDAVWSPDSKQIAFSVEDGGCDAEDTPPCPPYSREVYIVDVPARKVADISKPTSGLDSTGLLMQPRWSPDGSSLALLSFDPLCLLGNTGMPCSSETPAFYFMAVNAK